MGDAFEAHREEMLDAMVDAAMRVNHAEFEAFYAEWTRVDQGENRIRLAGLPQAYTAEGFCFHCSESWTVNGVIFDDEEADVLGAFCQAVHMISSCEGACYCYSSEKRESQICQLCLTTFEKCMCGVPSPGPCTAPMVTIVWAR